MAFKTFSAGSSLPASDLQTYLMNQAVVACTSGTHPSAPGTGMLIYETDNDSFLYWNGSAWVRPMPTKVGRAYFARSANITANTIVGVVPPTSGYHTASITDGSTSSNDTMTMLVDCICLVTCTVTGLSSATSANIRMIPNTQGDTLGQHFTNGFLNWGSNNNIHISWSSAMLTGDTIQLAFHNTSAGSSNTITYTHVAFIPAQIVTA